MYLRFPDLVARRIVGNWQTLYRWIRKGHFSKPVKLGGNTAAWPLEDVERWEAERLPERDKAIKTVAE